jgi:hypothetical protein
MDRIKPVRLSGPGGLVHRVFILSILFIHVKKVLAVFWLRHCRAVPLWPSIFARSE